MVKQYTRKGVRMALAAGIGLTAAVAYASTANITYVFSPNTPASANEVNTNFVNLKTAIDDNDARIANLEQGQGGPAPVVIDCASALPGAIQQAIDSAGDGPLDITLNGICTENIVIYSDEVSLVGGTGGGITAASNTDPAISIEGAAGVSITGLTISGGLNGISAALNATVSLSGNTVSGAVADPTQAVPTGAALFADVGSAVEILDNNSFTGSGGDDAIAVFIFRGSHVRLAGNGNTFDGGTPQPPAQPYALEAAHGSSITQEVAGTANAINGGLAVSSNSQVFLQKVAINGPINIENNSSLALYPAAVEADIAVTSSDIEVGLNSTLDIADDGIPLTINAAGVAGTMRLLDHSTLLMYSGSTINMNVELFRNSGIDAGDNSTIGGDLDVYNFSVAVFGDVTGAAVGGLVTCGIAEATSIDPALNASDLCGP